MAGITREDLSLLRANLSGPKRELLEKMLRRRGGRSKHQAPITRRTDQSEYPLSFAQQRLWFTEQISSASPLYIIPAAVRITGSLDLKLLEEALNVVAARHEVLRSFFLSRDGEPVQEVRETVKIPIVLNDVSSADDPEAESWRAAEGAARDSMPLSEPPLLAAKLIRIAETQHLLLVTMHHIIADEWSIGVLLGEMAEIYQSLKAGKPPVLPELDIQYADFASWERSWTDTREFAEHIEYWRSKLAEPPPPFELPLDHPRPSVTEFKGGSEPIVIPKALAECLKVLADLHGATAFMSLLSAFLVLVYRYTGQEDVLIGSPVAGRSRKELHKLIGCFVNVLPLRLRANGCECFGDVLDSVRAVAVEAYSHQEAPFERLVERLKPAREINRNPFFDVVFVFQNTPAPAIELPGLNLEAAYIHNGMAKFDLTVSLSEANDGIRGYIEYSSDLFDPPTIARLAACFVRLIESAVQQPAVAISRLPLLSESEAGAVLEIARPRERFDRSTCIHELFQQRAAEGPDRVAIVFGSHRVTYGELDLRANQLANILRREGAGPESLVCLVLDRSIQLVIGVLGVLKSGAAYVPVDPAYPVQRIALVIEDSLCRAIVAESRFVDRVPPSANQVILVDEIQSPGSESQLPPPGETDPSSTAYVIYTSGSTGVPKGVAVSHANVTRLFAAAQGSFNFSEEDVWTLFHSFAFDFSVWEMWGALLLGGQLIVVPYLTSRSPHAFRRLLSEERVTVLNQTPSAFDQLIDADAEADSGSLALETVVFGGEALDPRSLRDWVAKHKVDRPRLVNMYGITETTVHVTYREIEADDVLAAGSQSSPIGRTLSDLGAAAVDRNFEPSPEGVPGELLVGGAGVTRGYLNRPGLTAERFVPDVYSNLPGARVYRSGDLARRRNSGDLYYVGRLDHQVKIRGFRIEPVEIESALLNHPLIGQAKVLATRQGSGGSRLIAYIVMSGEPTPTREEITRFLRDRLPDYMVPADFVTLSSFPLTAHSKLDSSALPAPEQVEPESSQYRPPTTLVEEQLLDIWERVLHRQRIGVTDNFFDLGGDSILTIKVISLAKQAGLYMEVVDLFRYQTIRELSRTVRTAVDNHAVCAVTPFSLLREEDRARIPAGIEDAYPLTMLQAGMLFHSLKETQTSVYHNVSTLRLRGKFDPELFQYVVDSLVAQHPVLRTSFDLATFSQPLQLVHRALKLRVAVEEIGALTVEDQEEHLEQFFEAEKLKKFDWSRPPLLRITIHRLAPNLFQMTFSEHHAILDGWSVASLLSELFGSYLRLLNGGSPPAYSLDECSFANYVRMETEAVASQVSREFWMQKLSGATGGELLGLADSHAQRKIRSNEIPIPRNIATGLAKASQTCGVPIKHLFMAAHLKVISQLTGQRQVVTGLVTNGRPESAGGDTLLGLFLNTLPSCMQVGRGSWSDLARSAFEVETEMLPHRRFPLPEIQKLAGGESVFRSAFNFVHFHIYRSVAGLEGIELVDEKYFEETDFALLANFSLDPETSDPRMQVSFDLSVFDPFQTAAIASYYSRALESIAADPNTELGRVSVLSESEQHKLLYEWNEAEAEGRFDAAIHQLFERNAVDRGDAVALGCEDQQLTYNHLNRRANQLANYLLRMGAGPETRICLAIERSVETVVAIIAVLKTGSAYVPVDPGYPAERISLIVEDSECMIAVTEGPVASQLTPIVSKTIILDRVASQLECERDENLRPLVWPDSAAYVIYTSGSTGKPKGVVVSHHNTARLFRATCDWYRFSSRDVWTLFHSFAFDFSVWEIWGALIYGGKLVIVPFMVSRSPDRFHRLLMEERVTVLNQTPSAFRQLVEADRASATPASLAIREVIFGGEALDLQSLTPWVARHRNAPRLVNMYGITETTVHVTYRPVSPDEIEESTASPVGRPIRDLSLYVLSEDMNQLPLGAAGEMFVGGQGLARGYLNQPELTAESFLPNPFGGRAGSRLYRSGDIARFMRGADVHYVGRRDQQVKIRGFRIELGEIEAALMAHPDVSDAKVLTDNTGPLGSSPANARLVAYVIAAEGARFSAADAKAFLKNRLPEYMVPTAIVSIDAFPLTLHGKLDVRRLPSPDAADTSQTRLYVEPQGQKESALAEIWRDVLGVERVGATDNFFDIGGDSIRAIQVRARAEQAGIDISIQQLFATPTVRALAISEKGTGAERRRSTRPFSLISGADRERLSAEIEDAYPLSSLQMGMLYHSLYDESSTAYHNVSSMRLRGALNIAALGEAINEVVSRHAVLRTSFDLATFSEPLQLVHRSVKSPFSIEDLRGYKARERAEIISAFFELQRERKFDLLTAPLIRFHLHLLTDETFQFSWTEHHAILDGWSVASMITEIVAVYHELNLSGERVRRPQAAIALRDFIALELDAIQSEECRGFWERKVADHSGASNGRRAAKRKGAGTRRMETVERLLDGPRLKSIKEFAAAAGVPLKSALLMTHFRVQALLSGSANVVVRVVSNGRPEEEGGETVLGLFLNTLPLTLNVSGKSLAELARTVFQAEQEVLPYRRYPLSSIEQLTDGQIGLDSLFTFVHFHVVDAIPANTGLEVEELTSAIETNFGIEVEFILEGSINRLRLVIKYDIAEFGDEPFASMADYYDRAIQQMIAWPGERVENLTLLSSRETNQIIYGFNPCRLERSASTVLDLLAVTVGEGPDRVALLFGDDALTYKALNDLTDALSKRLRRMTAARDPLVAVCLDRSLETAASVLAVIKSGAAYLPLDPTYPKERLEFMLGDSRTDLLITERAVASQLSLGTHTTLFVEDIFNPLWDSSTITEAPTIGPPKSDDPAYIIYTSGSTGQPKGVVMTHRALVNIISWQIERFGEGPSGSTLQFAPISFDVSIQEMMSTWCSGGRLVVLNDELRRDPNMLLKFLRDDRTTRLFMPFIALQQLAEAFDESGQVPDALTSVITAGEQLRTTSQIRRLFEAMPGCYLENQYGPTETHVVTSHQLAEEAESWEELPPIGRPVSNTEIYILDQWLQPVAIGVAGELCIAGDCLARGYLNRPELTAERFRPSPFSGAAGARAYSTGDVARHRQGGEIEFLGRMDRQIKLRGFRVEIGELEAALDGHPSVAQCAVDVRENERSQKQIVAYYVKPAGPPIPAVELKAWMTARLPEYMVPSVFTPLDRMPLTASGKINRRALPPPDFLAGALEQRPEYAPPSTMSQAILTDIWRELLPVAKIGIRDDFFDVGGNSLLATQVMSRIRRKLAVDLPVRVLFEAPTIEALAKEVELYSGIDSSRLVITGAARPDRVPLAPAQQRLWLVDRVTAAGSAYNMPIGVWLKGLLAHHSIDAALNQVVRRHETLRTVIKSDADAPSQLVQEYDVFTVKSVDLTRLTVAEARDTALLLATQEANRWFDLEKGPLFRALLVTVSRKEHLLVLNMHHIVSDGWSLTILTGDMAALYTAMQDGSRPPLGDLPIQYSDYSIWQREHLTGSILEAGLSYWKQLLLDAPPELPLPVDRPRGTNQSHRGATREFDLDRSLTSAIVDLGRREGATPFMTMLAAFVAFLFRYARENDLVIGAPVSGRNLVDTEGLIGFFVNTLPLRFKIDPEARFQDALVQARETVLSAMSHQEIPFEVIVDELHPDRVVGRSSIVQVMFTLDGGARADAEIPGLTTTFIGLDSETSKFDLTLSLAERDGHISGAFQYDVELFDGTTVQRMAGHFSQILNSIVSSAHSRILDLPLLSPAEMHILCYEDNDTSRGYRVDDCVDKLFDAQVESGPDRVALVFEDCHVVYLCLQQRAAHLSARLLAAGSAPDVPIGLCVARSPEAVVGLLAILKSGSAYLPLDPEYPEQRLNAIVKDSGARIVVVDQGSAGRFESVGAATMLVEDNSRSEQTPRDSTGSSLAGNLAYVVYTSGSTGRPKGIGVTHRAVVRLITDTNYIALTSDDIVAQVSTISFDAATFEIWGALLNGARLVITERDVTLSPSLIERFAREHQITTLFLTTALFNELVRETPDCLATVDRVLFGGESVDAGRVARFLSADGRGRLLHVYGPTETTTYATWHAVNDSDPACGTIPIGRPISNSTLYVLDDQLRPVPFNVKGELYIGGDGLARCYIGNPAHTGESFVPSPFPARPGDRLYKTGDLGRRRPTSDVAFLGRIDSQVKIRGFRIEPAEIESALRTHPRLSDAAVVPRRISNGRKRLVAYVVRRQGPGSSNVAGASGTASTPQDLRSFLQSIVPDYMIPSAFVFLDRLPLNRNGKVDRKALPEPGSEMTESEGTTEPASELEATLVRLWAECLGLARVGVNDNFFELGGDSILSIELAARAKRAGIGMTPSLIFQHQTVAQLASVIHQSQPAAPPGDLAPTGTAPLTPIQCWFFEQDLPEPDHFNLDLTFEPAPGLSSEAIIQALLFLPERHLALNARYQQVEGAWRQTILERTHSPFVANVDLSNLSEGESNATFERLAGEGQQSLNLAEGPLIRALLCSFPGTGRRKLFITIHHLLVDWVSWRILAADLDNLSRQIIEGTNPAALPTACSFKGWGETLCRYASSPDLAEESSYWLALKASEPELMPLDTGEGVNDVGSERWFEVSMDESLSRLLVQEAPLGYRARAQDLLMTALLLAWRELTSSDSILLDLESHGRAECFPGVDLSGTAGWFTSMYPLRITLPEGSKSVEAVQGIRRQLESVPNYGIGFGVLRYLCANEDLRRAMESVPKPEVSFNYLGQFDQALPQDPLFLPVAGRTGEYRNPRGLRSHILDVQLSIADRKLWLALVYSENRVKMSTIQKLAALYLSHLERLILDRPLQPACRSTVTNTPAPLVDQSVIDLLRARFAGIEDAYPLTPMQEGMLLHSLDEPDSGVYCTQLVLTLEGTVDPAALIDSWRQLVERHSILRTGFAWKGLPRPVQAVHSRADLAFEQRNWQGLPGQKQELELQRYLISDRKRGFDLERPSLMRLMLASTGEAASKLAWSFHHLLLDGWCLSILLDELRELYVAAIAGRRPQLPEPLPFRSYVEWLQSRKVDEAIGFWAKELDNLGSKPLGGISGDEQGKTIGTAKTQTRNLSREATDRLTAFARANHLTVNTAILGAWAILVSRYSGSDDVVFGTVVSGRPPDLPDAERILGLFINTLPLRIRLVPDQTILSILNLIQTTQTRMRRYEYCSLNEIKKWAGLAANQELFDSILAFENYPWRNSPGNDPSELAITGIRGEEQTNFPVVLAAVPGEVLSLRLTCDESRFEGKAALRMLEQLETILSEFSFRPGRAIGESSMFGEAKRSDDESPPALPRSYQEHTAASLRPSALSQMEKERILAKIWSEVLGVVEVKHDDDFFSLGGDSILSMQVCSRAAGFGLKLTPGQVLRERVLANVAALASDEEPLSPDSGPVAGELPLSPIQHWFFELGLDTPDTYNQSVLFATTHVLHAEAVSAACREILEHHDALRLRFTSRDGCIFQVNEQPGADVPFRVLDLGELPGRAVLDEIGNIAEDLFHSISLTHGPLVQLAMFTSSDDQRQWLLFVIHHLAVDGVSWRILLEDFWVAYDQAEQGLALNLPPRTTSFREWAHRLVEFASSERAISQREFWLSQFRRPWPSLTTDMPRSEGNPQPRTMGFELPPDKTRALLTLVGDRIQAALAAALVESLVPLTSSDTALIDFEGHGRESIFQDVNLSRTVGWFTATYPVRISTRGATGWPERLRQVAEQLRCVPDGGIGYGALRYLSGQIPHALDGAQSVNARFMPEVSLNYLGQFDQSLKRAEKHALPADWAGPRLTSVKLAHLIEVNAMVTGSSLVITILFDESLYFASTIEQLGNRLIQSLREIIEEAGKQTVAPVSSR